MCSNNLEDQRIVQLERRMLTVENQLAIKNAREAMFEDMFPIEETNNVDDLPGCKTWEDVWKLQDQKGDKHE